MESDTDNCRIQPAVRPSYTGDRILVQRAAESSNLVKSERVTWPLTGPEDVCTVPSLVAGYGVYSPGRLQSGLSTGTELRGEENYER